MIILIHSSKTMRDPAEGNSNVGRPALLDRTRQLVRILQKLSVHDVEKIMAVSPKLAATTHRLMANWTDAPDRQRAAVDSFLGDIYSGLQVQSWSAGDKTYAQSYLRILSGLYGILKPYDGIYPYRFEMGYRMTDEETMYEFWGNEVAKTIPGDELILNLSAVEYSKVITKYIDAKQVVMPKFLTISPKTGEPTFVVVHAKIARGAFASWCIKNRVSQFEQLQEFNELGYRYDANSSTAKEPVFICKSFKGLGLSVRLS